jgi:CHAT domain-containing protein
MMKEDEYFDFIQRGDQADPRSIKAALTPTETAGTTRYEEVSAEIGAMANERAKLRRKEKPDDAEVARLVAIENELRSAKKRFDAVLGEIHHYFAHTSAERALEIGRMNLAELKAIQGTLEQLGEGTVTLHYVLLDDKVRILLTTPRIQVARESAIDLPMLNRRIQSFRENLQHPDRDAKIRAADLYRLLIAPVAKDLEQAEAKTIMLSLDGALRYLPFAALHDGEKFLIEKYRLTLFAEAARDKLKDKPVAEWRAAGLGMTQSVEGFSPLPSVAEELNAIVRTGTSLTGVIPGRISLDRAFSRKAVLGALDEGFPVLHIASHFVFKPGTELESFLLMGDKSRLSLKEMKEDDYDFRKVELIALSACETAVGGGADNFGREIEGFAALVQKQGARSVMATLWQVADESTAELMALFYANRSAGHLSKAEALRQAQLTLLRGEVGSDEATTVTQRAAVSSALKIHSNVKSGRYSHPYFWAPFILTGNWL